MEKNTFSACERKTSMLGKIFYAVFAALVSAALIGCTTAPKPKSNTVVDMILNGKSAEAKSLFETKTDINETDDNGNSALHAAAQANDVDMTTFLLIKGADTEMKNHEGDTPLHVAVTYGSVEAAQTLATGGADIFARNANNRIPLDMGLEKDPRFYDVFITQKSGRIRDTGGETIVHYFVRTRNAEGVRQCIKRGLPISVKSNEGKTPLDTAFEDANDIDAIEIAADLIMGGADRVEGDFEYFYDAVSDRNIDMKFEDGQTALHYAAIMGHGGIARYLLENGASATAKDTTGSTALHEAVRYGHADIAQMLLGAGASVNATDNMGKTPIMLYVPDEAQSEMYPLLISYKADVTRADAYGDTVLHTATMTSLPTGILTQLVAAGADVNARNKDGVTPLLIASQKQMLEHVEFYSSLGADIHSEDKNGVTPLKVALGDDDMLEHLVNRVNVTSLDSSGNTPLHVAILADANIEKTKYILSLMDDVNARNREGNSALYLAVLKHNQKVIEILLEKNADIFSCNSSDYSPLRLALTAGGDVQDWLITNDTIKAVDGSGNSALHFAASWGLKNAAAALIAKGADTEAKNSRGEVPMFNAAQVDSPDLIEVLISSGANVNTRDNLGSTALHVAVRWDSQKAARRLIQRGADVNAQNTAGKSPLAEAALAGKIGTSRILMDAGSDRDSSDKQGRTILMDAIRGQNAGVVAMLLDNGANPQIQDVNGRNAYHEAVLTGRTDIISLVRDAGGNPLARDKRGITPFELSLDQDERVTRTVLGHDRNITDSDGNTPVHIIVMLSGSLDVLNSLIRDGYPCDTLNAKGATPLSIAVERGEEKYALLLLQNDANPFCFINKQGESAATIALNKDNERMIAAIVKYAGDKSDIQGNTMLHYAAKSSSIKTINTLLSYGLSKTVRNISGETPSDTAVRWRRSDVASLLAP